MNMKIEGNTISIDLDVNDSNLIILPQGYSYDQFK